MTEFVEYLARGVVQLRANHDDIHAIKTTQYSRFGGAAPKQTILGGYVRSYRFQYDPSNPIAQGTMTIESSDAPYQHEQEVTILFLSDKEACNGITGERIVAETRKLANCSDSVLEAHFSAYCEAVGRWVVVYEKFDRFLSGNEGTLPPFFADQQKSTLNPFWRAKVRSLVGIVSLCEARQITHGGLREASSYVISSGTVKIINVGRFQQSRDHVDDLYHLRHFIWSNSFFKASYSVDWAGFHYLLGSRKMHEKRVWESVVLNHPILLEPDGILVVIEGLETFMWGKDFLQRKFGNALYVKMPSHRWSDLKYYIDSRNHVLVAVLKMTNPHPIIYLAIIQYARNIHLHANDHTNEFWDSSRIVQEINRLFPGFVSMAYSVRHVTDADWNDLINDPNARKFRRDFYR